MDDDLMSLRGGGRSNNDDDDLFGSFADPDDLGFDAPPPPASGSGMRDLDDLDLGDPFDFDSFEAAPAAAAAAPQSAPARSSSKKQAKPRRARRSSARGFLGLRPQELMLLSIFLFLDVLVFGLLILVVLGAVNLQSLLL